MRMGRFNLELTNRCNFRCVYCPESISVRPPRDMDPRLAVRLLSWAARSRRFPFACFASLGEPLLYPYLNQVVKAAKKQGFITFLPTNGAALTEKRLLGLLDAKLDYLVLGINAASSREFMLRNAKLSFRDYMRTVRLRVRDFMRISSDQTALVLCYLSSNGMRVPNSMKLLYSKREEGRLIRFWTTFIQRCSPLSGRSAKQSAVGRAVREYFGSAGRVSQLSKNIYLMIRPLELALAPEFVKRGQTLSPVVKKRCPLLSNDLTVLSDGSVTFCAQKDYDGRIDLGNVYRTDIDKIFYGKKAQGLMRVNAFSRLLARQCQQCQALARNTFQVTGGTGI